MTGISGIVVGVNAVDLSRGAIGWAVAEAEARRVPVRLVYAIKPWATPEPALLAGAYVWPELPVDTLREIAEETLQHAVTYARTLSADVEITTEAHQGDAVSVLQGATRPDDLIVIGSRNLGTIRSALFGSTGTGLAHTSSTPFVVVRGDGPSDMEAPIVVGVNPTSVCEPVLAAGFEHAAAHHRPLKALMCWEPFYYAPHNREHNSTDEVRAEAELWLAEAVAGFQEVYPDVKIDRDLVFEYPAAALIDATADASLVVVGVGRHHALRMLGSVATSVLHHAACPVEVIPR